MRLSSIQPLFRNRGKELVLGLYLINRRNIFQLDSFKHCNDLKFPIKLFLKPFFFEKWLKVTVTCVGGVNNLGVIFPPSAQFQLDKSAEEGDITLKFGGLILRLTRVLILANILPF